MNMPDLAPCELCDALVKAGASDPRSRGVDGTARNVAELAACGAGILALTSRALARGPLW